MKRETKAPRPSDAASRGNRASRRPCDRRMGRQVGGRGVGRGGAFTGRRGACRHCGAGAGCRPAPTSRAVWRTLLATSFTALYTLVS